jgi:hypothetical protein
MQILCSEAPYHGVVFFWHVSRETYAIELQLSHGKLAQRPFLLEAGDVR